MASPISARTIAAAAQRWRTAPGEDTERALAAYLGRLLGEHLALTDWWDRHAHVDGILVERSHAGDGEVTVTGRAIYEDGRGGWWCAPVRAVLPARGDLPFEYVLQFGDADRDDEPYGQRRHRPAAEPRAWRATFAPREGS